MIITVSTYSADPGFRRVLRRAAVCFACFSAMVIFGAGPALATGTLPPEIQKAVTELLALEDPQAPLPGKATLDTFLGYTTSPVSLAAAGEKDPYPAKYKKGSGIIWRSRIQNAPLATSLSYLYNPKVPTTVVFPASIRYASWQPGSDILNLANPLWEQFGKHKDAPLVLRGKEKEEITPDDNSGSYYSYLLNRVLILTEFEGKQMLISLSWQNGKSDVGKKAAHIGDYSNWDFVYSGAKGTLKSGIGWAETFIYSSAAITVFYEDAPGGNSTGYALYRWMDAGWSGMNMVKQHHIAAGAERSFAGIKALLESPKRPSVEEIEKYVASLGAMELTALQERFMPYSVKVEEAAATVDDLKQEDFQKIIMDAGYGKSMNKDEIIAAFVVNFIKEKLGKPLLAGPLDGK